MKKIISFALILAVALLCFGCYDSTPYDENDIQEARDEGYRKGYEEGKSEGFEAGRLSVIEGDEDIVYLTPAAAAQNYFATKTGKCFHLPSCQYRSKAVYWFATREEALAKGYRPCSKCNP